MFLKLKVVIKGRAKNNVWPYLRGTGKKRLNNHINHPKFAWPQMHWGISWVLLVGEHLTDPWAEEGFQCRSSLTGQIFQCSWNEFCFKMRWAVTLSASLPTASTQQMQLTPAKLKSTLCNGRIPALVGNPGVTHAPAVTAYTGGAGMVIQSAGDPAAKTQELSLPSIHFYPSLSYLYICSLPFSSLQTIVHFLILGNALKKSIFGLRILKYLFF